MAEVVALEAQVKGISNIKELRTALKEAKNELLQFEVGSEGFTRAQAKVSALSEKMKDLGDSVKIQGSGVERLKQSFGLLTESLTSGSLDKAKLAFTGIGQAMSAIPIFLLIEGIQYLIQNFDKLIDFVKEFTGETEKAEKAIRKQNDAIQEQKFLADELSNTYKNYAKFRDQQLNLEIEKLKQVGATQHQINQATIQAEEDKLKKMQEIKNQAFNDGLNITKAQAAIVDQQNKIDLMREQDKTGTILENRKKVADKLKQDFEDFKKNAQPELEFISGIEYKKYDIRKQYNDAALRDLDNFKKNWEKNKADELKKEKEIAAAKLSIQKAGLDAGKALSDAVFQIQLNRAKGNQAAELKIRKEMFEVDKAFNVARTIQDGIRSVQAALTIPPPYGTVLAGINGALAAANVAKILATKFDPGATASTPDLSTGSQTSVPQIPTTQTRTQGTTLLDDFGRPIGNGSINTGVGKSYVVAKELSSKIKDEERVAEISRF